MHTLIELDHAVSAIGKVKDDVRRFVGADEWLAFGIQTLGKGGEMGADTADLATQP